MHIALVVPGGVDRSAEYRVIPALLALIARLSARNDVQVIALNQESRAGEWDLAGARIHNIGRPCTCLRALHALHRLHRAAHFDVVQSVWSGAGGLVALAAGKAFGIPSLVHIGGGELASIPDIAYGGARTLRGRLRETWILKRVSAVTAASAPALASLSELGIPAHPLPLGVDLVSWPPRAPRPRDPSKPARLIHVASLNRVKDQTTLLRALDLLRNSGADFRMDVVGEDILGGEIQALAVQLGLLERITFHGFLPQARLRPLIEAADLMIVSSRHETGPLVALEAAVAGVPTVGTMVGHIAEWAPTAAVAVPVGDAARMARAVRELLENDERRLEIAREAMRRAVRQDADYTAEHFMALYRSLT